MKAQKLKELKWVVLGGRDYYKDPPRWQTINAVILAELPDHLKELYKEAVPYLDGSNCKDQLPSKFNELFEHLKSWL